MNQIIVYAAIYICFIFIGAYATTDIIRLLRNSTTPVYAASCSCPVCGTRLPVYNQIPVISYAVNRGRCRYCSSPIPISNLFYEIIIGTGCSLIATIGSMSWNSYWICIAFYEAVKIVSLIISGPRHDRFLHNFVISLLLNALIFAFVGVIFGISHIVL